MLSPSGARSSFRCSVDRHHCRKLTTARQAEAMSAAHKLPDEVEEPTMRGMNGVEAGRDRWGALAHVGAGVAATAAVSAAIAALGWTAPGPSDLEVLPGAAVALVWTGLIGGLGAARWLARRSGDDARRQQGPITALALACLLYPFYTLGLSSPAIGFAANVAIAVACARIADQLAPSSKPAALLVALPIPWLVFACALIGREWLLAAS